MFFCFKKRSFLSLEKEGDKLAVSGSDIDVSWSELKQKVDHQVVQLHKKTNGLTVPVILYGHKEADFIVLILACLILEIPFVPIDISYPEKRIDKVKQQLKKGLLVDVASGLITLFGKGEVCSQKNQNDPLTYVIFTSGSTGDPKGVQISASNVNNFIVWSQESFDLSSKQVFMNQALLSFDLSIFELVNALSLGASLVLMDRKVSLDIELFKGRFLAYHCNVWVSTPSFAFAFGFDKTFNDKNFPHLDLMIFCGEVLSRQLANLLLSHFSNLKLFNTYGPTETTVMVSSIQINRDILNTYKQLPIGNTNIDCHIDIQNSGIFEGNVTGELLISGKGVSIGYLNANNNDNFTTNKEGVYYYATGDMAYQQDNRLFFAGRQDNMIKYNGHRIDLGEINHIIEQLEDVSNVRTLPLERNGRVIRLVAFIQTSDSSMDIINTYLEHRLPKYMIPSEYVFHSVFPLTHNLKIDSQQLLKQYMDF